ncbi:MAG TPA: helix-turn-helix domain-containing protein [Bacteroidia bacterium]|jgi:excisionase family DNA binding protein|nr:helix-turn-helix domain-containing protein [Bacteroidia bacterium]
MYSENKPLFTLSIGEFIALAKELINETINEKELEKKLLGETADKKDEHFNIKELADFLKCSKVTIHKYKKNGLPFYRTGRKVLFKKTEVLNFMRVIKSKRVIQG